MKNGPEPTGIVAIRAPVAASKTETASGVVDDPLRSSRSSTWLTHTSLPSGVTATLVGFDPGEPTDELAVGVSVPTTFRVAVSITLTEPGVRAPLFVT